MDVKSVCSICKIEFVAPHWRHKIYCSHKCRIQWLQTLPQVKQNHLKGTLSGKNSPNWKGGTTTRVDGRKYLTINKKKIPMAHINWMKANQFYLIPNDCVIHHIDNDQSNDNPENLVLLPDSFHRALHLKLNNYNLKIRGVESGFQ